MLIVRKQKSITAKNRCTQVSFSHIAKTSHILNLLVLSEKTGWTELLILSEKTGWTELLVLSETSSWT